MNKLRILKNSRIILRTLLLSLLLSGFFLLFSVKFVNGFSQQVQTKRIALAVEKMDEPLFRLERINQIREIGIDMLEISFPNALSDSDLEQFLLLLDSENHYLTEYEVSTQWKTYFNSIQASYDSVPNPLRDNVTAIKVFDFPADYNSSFHTSTDSLFNQLSKFENVSFFYQSAFSVSRNPIHNVDFVSNRIQVQTSNGINSDSNVILFEPSNDVVASLQKLERILNKSIDEPESLIIIPADWFISRLDAQSSFSTIISAYLNGESVIFPMPAERSNTPKANWPIILILIIWASFIIHYKYQPMYKATLPRYFFNHSFFVHDVRKYRIRNATSGSIILLQHAVLTGFLLFLLAEGFMSRKGLESLSYHYPGIIIPGFEKISLFGLGFFVAISSHIISLTWLYFPNKNLNQLNQVINLYSWPFHLNLIVVTFTLYFAQIQSAENWALASTIIFIFFWFSSFTIAAVDGALFLKKYRALNLFLTAGLHFLLITLLIILLLRIPTIYQPIEMAFMLP